MNAPNRVGCTAITSTVRTTPQASLELMTHLMPIDLHIKEPGVKAYARLKHQLDPVWNSTTFTTPHLQYWENLNNTIEGEDDRCNITLWNRNFKILWDSRQGNKNTWQKCETTIYTDGSKISGKVGSGYVVYTKNKLTYKNHTNLSNECTVFQAEINAIYMKQESIF